MRIYLKQALKRIFNAAGFELTRVKKNSRQGLLGLRTLPVRTVIDVGANTGQFAREVLDIFPEAGVYCFEPLPEPFQQLTQWAKKQKSKKISLFNMAVGEKAMDVDMFVHADHSPSSSFLETTKIVETLYPFTRHQVAVRVKVTTLDQWFDALPEKPALDILLKLDVQGYEERVLRGASRLLGLSKACILEVALDELYKDQATFKNIFNLMEEHGYKYAGNLNQAYADNGHVVYIDAVFIKQDTSL